MVDDVSVCNRALQMLGGRDNISSLTAAQDDSEEAANCRLIYDQIRDQVLSMAWWNFARKTKQLNLVKAAPGTPEAWSPSFSPNNQGTPAVATLWFDWLPAPPWLYAYQYPTDCIQFRYLTPQPSGNVLGTPIFSTPSMTYYPSILSRAERFITATATTNDLIDIQGITNSNPAIITAAGHAMITNQYAWITGVNGMPEINTIGAVQVTAIDANHISIPVNTTNFGVFGPPNYVINSGTICNLSSNQVNRNIILTNTATPIGNYTMRITDLNVWGAQAVQALVSALAGYLAIPLTSDRNLAVFLIRQANDVILAARASDGNEGYTVQDSLPDWIAARSGYSAAGADLSYGGMLYSPYPPLFSIS
jgi:hypothetical protein